MFPRCGSDQSRGFLNEPRHVLRTINCVIVTHSFSRRFNFFFRSNVVRLYLIFSILTADLTCVDFAVNAWGQTAKTNVQRCSLGVTYKTINCHRRHTHFLMSDFSVKCLWNEIFAHFFKSKILKPMILWFVIFEFGLRTGAYEFLLELQSWPIRVKNVRHSVRGQNMQISMALYPRQNSNFCLQHCCFELLPVFTFQYPTSTIQHYPLTIQRKCVSFQH